MRILLLAQFFPPDIGGEERHVFNLATTLAARGHEVAVATQRMVDVPDQETLASGVRVHRFATAAMRVPGVYSTNRTHHPPLPDPLGVRELSRITRQERPDVVHAHNWIVNTAVALRRSSPTGPRFGLVLTLHDFSHVCATKRLMRMGSACEGPGVARCLSCATAHYGPAVGPLTAAATALMRPWKDRAIDHVVCVSNAVASGNHIPRGPNTSVIPNFVLDQAVVSRAGDAAQDQAEEIPPGVPKEEFLLFVGELSRDKGLPPLLRAYESLGKERPPLLLVGRRAPDTPTHLPYGAQIRAEWPHDQVMAAFRRCLFAVLPSICLDACPTTVLEAMASGRPVVATTTGGIVDMIVDGENGLLVPPDDEYRLAAAIARLLNDANLRARLATGALERVRGFTASAVAERLEAVYARVAPQKSDVSEAQPGESRRTRRGPAMERNVTFAKALGSREDQALRRPLRVLMVCPRYLPEVGGTEMHVREVTRRLSALGSFEITVLATDRSRLLPRQEVIEGIPVLRVPAWPRGRDYYLAPGIGAVIRQGSWDLVHCQGIHTPVPLLAMIAARRADIPYLVTFHTGGHSIWLRNAMRTTQWRLAGPLLRQAVSLVAVSHFEAVTLARQARLGDKQVIVIRNGGALPPPRAGTAAVPGRIVSSGRLERYKGHHRVIEALPHVMREVPEAHLLILGSGSYESNLYKLARHLGVSDRVSIRHIAPTDRQGMATALAGSSVIAALSDYEAHPVAVMEALCVARPVVGYDIAGVGELSAAGWVRGVPRGAPAAAVAHELVKAMSSPSPVAHAQLPSWDSCADQLAHVYLSALGVARDLGEAT